MKAWSVAGSHKAHGAPAANTVTGVRLKVVGEQLAVRDTGDTTSREKNVFHESRILCLVFHAKIVAPDESRTLHHEMGWQRRKMSSVVNSRPGALQVEGKDVLEDMPMRPVNEWMGERFGCL